MAADTQIVVLSFSGSGGAKARSKLIGALKQRYEILPTAELQRACDDLGLEMSRGESLAVCSSQIGATAVVGGSLKKRRLKLAVFSGASGAVLVNKKVRWSRKPTRAQLKEALRVIIRGVDNAPPLPGPAGAGAAAAGGGLTFEAEAVTRTDDQPTAGDDFYGQDAEDPFAPGAAGAAAAAPAAVEDAQIDRGDPKVWGYLGFGIWMRSFELDNPRFVNNIQHPTYDSGAAATLRFAAAVRPLAFFLDNFAADFFARLHYQMTIGLESNSTVNNDPTAPPAPTEGPFSTSISEFLMDIGYAWNILGGRIGPRIAGSVGFGVDSFSIDWGTATPQMPNTSYPFIPLRLGVNYPFAQLANDALLLGIHAIFDYRLVMSIGDIADPDDWYGPGSGSGLSFTAGLDVEFKKWIFGIEYGYTGFSLSFDDDPQARADAGLHAADGASDSYHSFLLTAGYSY